MKRQKCIFVGACALAMALVHAQPSTPVGADLSPAKCGVIDAEKVFKNSLLAKDAKKRIENEFKSRDEALQRRAKEWRRLEYLQDVAKDEKDEARIQKIQRELDELMPIFRKDSNDFRRDLERRRGEELKLVIKLTESAYKKLAAQENYQKIYQTSETEPIFYVPEARRLECNVKKDISVDVIRILDVDLMMQQPVEK